MKPFIIVCGAPKTGKSFASAMTFQNSLAILTAVKNMHYYKSQLNTKLKEPITRIIDGVETQVQLRPPKRIKLIGTHSTNAPKDSEPYSWDIKIKSNYGTWKDDGKGNRVLVPDPEGTVQIPVSAKTELTVTLEAVLSQCIVANRQGIELPYDAIIIDEWGKIMERAFEETPIIVSEKTGKEDTFAGLKHFNKWIEFVMTKLSLIRDEGLSICLVCHDRDPDVEKNKKGGVLAPTASIGKNITGFCDGAIMRILRDPAPLSVNPDGTPQKPKRLWKVTATEHWNIGIAGLDPDLESQCEEADLYTILTQFSGYEI